MSVARPATQIHVDLVRSPDELKGVEERWRELAVARGNPFLTPEWFAAWQRHFGNDAEPLVGVARSSSGDVVGILPLSLQGRTVRFAGSGLGDRFGIVAAPADEAAAAGAVGRALRDMRDPWSSMVLENVTTEAGWWREVSEASGRGPRPLVDRHSRLPGISLDGDWKTFLAGRSRNLRSQIGRRQRALEREHEVRVRWRTEGDPAEIERDMRTLFRLHDARWQSLGRTSSMTSERARAFHVDFASAAAERGWLRLAFLEVDADPVATWYGWRIGDRFAYYQAGFDPRWEKHSVGFVLFVETIRAAFEEGAGLYDMLLGDEPFKQRFATHDDRVCTVVIAPRMGSARSLAAAEAVVRRASRRLPTQARERLKQRVRPLLDRLPMTRRP